MPKLVRMLKTYASPKCILNEGKLYLLPDAFYKDLAPDNHPLNPMFDEAPEKGANEKVNQVGAKPDPGDDAAGVPAKAQKPPKLSSEAPKEGK